MVFSLVIDVELPVPKTLSKSWADAFQMSTQPLLESVHAVIVVVDEG